MDKRAVSFSTFMKAIREHREMFSCPKRKIMAMCEMCEGLHSMIRLAEPKSIYREELKMLKQQHHAEHVNEREKAERRRNKAKKAPNKRWYIMIDGMTQNTTCLPRLQQKTKEFEVGKMQVQVTGVLGWGTPIASAIYGSLPTVTQSANHTISIIQHF
jgi:hypothetical protein